MESRTNMYPCGDELMTVPSAAPGKLGFVNLDSVFEQRRRDSFIRIDFLLTIVEGRHQLFCIRKLATSLQPSTEWASRPTWMTLFTAPGSKVLTDNKLLKPSSSANLFW